MISGGIALGLGLGSTGLSHTLVANIPFAKLSPLVIVVMATVMGLLMSTFISNTATANLLLPIMAILGATVSILGEIGGSKLLVLLVTFSCSLAMVLPVSTPPNAMAYATGLLANRQLLQIGALISGVWFGGFLSVGNVDLANWILLAFILVVLVSLLQMRYLGFSNKICN